MREAGSFADVKRTLLAAALLLTSVFGFTGCASDDGPSEADCLIDELDRLVLSDRYELRDRFDVFDSDLDLINLTDTEDFRGLINRSHRFALLEISALFDRLDLINRMGSDRLDKLARRDRLDLRDRLDDLDLDLFEIRALLTTHMLFYSADSQGRIMLPYPRDILALLLDRCDAPPKS
jgi:hypothetical protein